MKPSIIVHGGAWNIPDSMVDSHIMGCEFSASAGHDLLMAGGTAVDAVEEAVRIMEDDPTFDSGRGSVLNQAAEVEMDAMIMDGRSLRSGAVTAIRHVRNPVRVARRLMETTAFSMLVGEGALRFALSNGFDECTEEDLLVGRELEDYKEFVRTGILRTREHFSGEGRDTVGACAVDAEGHLAASTSTGGTPRKIKGRVGDSAIVGCGTYADDRLGAASATGWGEKLMAVVFAKSALDLAHLCKDPNRACEQAVELLSTRVDGLGGIVMIDANGRIGYHHNTPRMAFSFIDGLNDTRGSGISRRADRQNQEDASSRVSLPTGPRKTDLTSETRFS